ncbi:hypothetical protein D9M68_916990 [compost metagenome]
MVFMSPWPSVMALSTAEVSITPANAGREVAAVTEPAMHRLRNERTGLNLAMCCFMAFMVFPLHLALPRSDATQPVRSPVTNAPRTPAAPMPKASGENPPLTRMSTYPAASGGIR